jgi:hypothetical protein
MNETLIFLNPISNADVIVFISFLSVVFPRSLVLYSHHVSADPPLVKHSRETHGRSLRHLCTVPFFEVVFCYFSTANSEYLDLSELPTLPQPGLWALIRFILTLRSGKFLWHISSGNCRSHPIYFSSSVFTALDFLLENA